MKTMTLRLGGVLLAVCGLAGVASAQATQPAAGGKTLDNPQYTAWAKFKPGTVVKYKQTTISTIQGTENKQEGEMTFKLLEVTPEQVVVEMTTSTTVQGQKLDMPPTKTTIPAKITDGDPAAAPTPPVPQPTPQVKEGQETVKAADKELACKAQETTVEQEGMKTVSKMWSSDEVPGGLVKLTTKSDGNAMKFTSEMVLVELKPAN